MKKLLSIFIIIIMIISCGKSVLKPNSNTKNNKGTQSFTKEDLLNMIRNLEDLSLNGINIKELVSASFSNAEYDQNNQIIITLERGNGFPTTKYNANKSINVETTLNTINQKIKEKINNPNINNISFTVDKNKLNHQVLTLKLNLKLKTNTKTDIDTNNIVLKLDLGELRNNKKPSILWWWQR